MYKLITFPSKKAFHFCVGCMEKEETFKKRAKHLQALETFLVPDEDYESFCQMIGSRKHHVSENVTVRLHRTADEIPWGIEKIGAPQLWSNTKGKGIKVAVIDTGISSSHSDLRGQVKGRVITANGGLGYSGMDGHGTHVAGTIAAVANQKGIVGVAPEVELYDVRAFGPDGTAAISDIVEGINWCIENRMNVINMSFGTSDDNLAMRNAVRRAAKAGIVLVASAGNNGGALEYPAAYPEVVAVGALTQDNKLASFSSRGRGLDVTAPGVGIKSTWLNNSYRVLDGTSMAAAHISGMYALAMASGNRKLVRGIRKNLKAAQ
ncbi:MAG TPA: S8 family peptidase [Candidatus Bathyarchaeia archaeon]|nr:S8 family peptidase [Candidatus Bathyarchaeia archaeon]